MTRLASPEVVFPALLALFGVLYAACLPPGQAPDENKHFLRAYHVSEGHLRAEPTAAGWAGGDLPESVGRFGDTFKSLRHDVTAKVNADTFRSLASDSLDPERRRATSFQGAEG